MSQTNLLDGAGVVWRSIGLHEANQCLSEWGHHMGAMNRPCMADIAAHALVHEGRPVAVALTAGLIRDGLAAAPWISRETTVELARLCACRRDLCRVALRLWREFTWPTFGRAYAISYQDAALHSGDLYRFDGWQRISYSSSGTDQRSGRKGRRKWIWQWPPKCLEARE